jgi:alkaline phosphatase D
MKQNRREFIGLSLSTTFGLGLGTGLVSLPQSSLKTQPTFLPKAFASNSQSLRIGFGSCLNSRRSQAMLQTLSNTSLDAFLLLGDNVYADNNNPASLLAEYEKLRQNSSFQTLNSNTTLLATWDDHDFGVDNGDKNYRNKDASRNAFLNFFPNVPNTDEAIYCSKTISQNGLTAHCILLDCRWHLDFSNDSVLGKNQWDWLEDQLTTPCDLILIGSSIQVLSNRHRFECWGKAPSERNKLLKLLQSTSKSEPLNPLSSLSSRAPVLLLSGDRHFHELTDGNAWGFSGLLEFTSSGLNMGSFWPFGSADSASSNPGRIWSSLGNAAGIVELCPRSSEGRLIAQLSLLSEEGLILNSQQVEIS